MLPASLHFGHLRALRLLLDAFAIQFRRHDVANLRVRRRLLGVLRTEHGVWHTCSATLPQHVQPLWMRHVPLVDPNLRATPVRILKPAECVRHLSRDAIVFIKNPSATTPRKQASTPPATRRVNAYTRKAHPLTSL